MTLVAQEIVHVGVPILVCFQLYFKSFAWCGRLLCKTVMTCLVLGTKPIDFIFGATGGFTITDKWVILTNSG